MKITLEIKAKIEFEIEDSYGPTSNTTPQKILDKKIKSAIESKELGYMERHYDTTVKEFTIKKVKP